MTRISIPFALLSLAALALSAPRTYLCYRASSPVAIDGVLDEPAWDGADWSESFVDIEGDLKPAPRFDTRVKMLWDDSCFYVAAMMEEPHLWATILKRDSIIFYDNDFEIFLDPDGDNFEYGEFEINALNTVWDLFLPKPYKDSGHPDDAWTITGLRSAVALHGTLNNPTDSDDRWNVEIALPWSGLARCAHTALPPTDGAQWRVNFSRVEWKLDVIDGSYRKVPNTPEDNWVWSPQHVINMHRPESWGIVQFTRRSFPTTIAIADRFQAERDILHLLYYAQVEFHKQHQRWCGSVDSLSIDPALRARWPLLPTITITDSGYQASLPAATITQDSRFLISR